jgi:hypothetical protein
MHDILINKETTIRDLEALMGTSDLGFRDLILPNSLTEESSLGISLAFTQFLLTWARRCDVPVAKTFLPAGEENSKYTRFVQRAHGFAAAYYAKRILAHNSPDHNLRRSLLLAAKPRFEAMYQGELNGTCRPLEIELIFIENSEIEFHGALYSKAPMPSELADRESHGRLVRSKRDLNRLLERAFAQLGVKDQFKKQLLRVDLPFGSMLTEAFKNTAEHGYLQPDGTRLKKNLRCVRIARSQTGKNWLKSFSVSSEKSSRVAKSYFGKLASEGDKARANAQMLEISIFDSGSGFSATMGNSRTSDQLSDQALVELCVEKHKSSKPQENAGAGIHRILSAVDALGGFLRIRTSSAEAFYAASEGFTPEMPPATFVHGGLASVEGTLITVGIPIAF